MILNIILLLRPKQWIKNGFVLFPLLFSLRLDDVAAITNALIATVIFILLSGIVYIYNDIMDVAEDRLHPKKSKRPIASGAVSVKTSYLVAATLLVIVGLLATLLPENCFIIMAIYLVVNAIYSVKLKHYAIIDVLIIASGFILRVLMGGAATDIILSPWIIMTTFLLALFLGFGKRYQELDNDNSAMHRSSLTQYNLPLLDRLISISCSATLISYSLYAIEIARETGKTQLVYTTFFVVFGLFRYLQAIYVHEKGDEPESILFKDFVFLANILVWLCTTLWILSL